MLNFVKLIVSIGLIVGAGVAFSQDYPTKPIRIFAGSAGGGSDAATRLIAGGIAGPLGQPIIVENRGGSLPELTVAKAAPDGYTLLSSGSSIAIGPLLEPMDLDAVRDFSPITMTTRSPNVLIVHPSLPVKSVKELIALAKARPGELNFGSASPGSSAHLAGELFKSMAGVNLQHIPFSSTNLSVLSLIRGEVQVMFASTGASLPYIKVGRVRALAVTTLEPSTLVPGLPTVSASGLPGYEFMGFDGIYAPAKTPTAIVNQLNREIVRVLNQPDVKEKFLNSGGEVVGSTPEVLGNSIKSETVKWGKVIKEAGIKTK